MNRYRHRNLSVIVPVSPYKILYSYVALVPAPSCIWQYKFVHKFAGTLDTAYIFIADSIIILLHPVCFNSAHAHNLHTNNVQVKIVKNCIPQDTCSRGELLDYL